MKILAYLTELRSKPREIWSTMPVVALKNAPAGVPPILQVSEKAIYGGEGIVYFSHDDKFAVKIYHNPPSNKESLLDFIMSLFDDLPPDQERFILPPLALVDSIDGQKRIGFIMRRVPPSYKELVYFMLNPKCAARQFREGRSWADYLKVARSIANAIVVLHGKGCAHSDIHFRNFLVDLDEGDAIMLEIDGIVVPGFLPPQVAGMMGFMAPEILTEGVKPEELTDRYSLAVLILHTLLFRNPMLPLIEYDDDPNKSEELGWGKHALFSEHPGDHRHRPGNLGLPLYKGGALSYRMLTPSLQQLTERALIDGVRAPQKRPTSWEWEEALAYAFDELWMCSSCKQYFPYPYRIDPQHRKCPFCGEGCAPPLPAVLELFEKGMKKDAFSKTGRRVVLGHKFKIFSDMVESGRKPPLTRKKQKVVGHVEWDAKHEQYRLINDEDTTWIVSSPDGVLAPGESLPLVQGQSIDFGEGRRLFWVQEV